MLMICCALCCIYVFRLLICIRIVVLALFLTWRVRHPNEDAIWLWGMSVVCEIWFAFSWLLDQLPKLCPINRATDLNVLKEKFETCYIDAVKTGGGICPGCKEPYKNTELDEVAVENGRALPFPQSGTVSKMERRLSLMKSTKSVLMRSQTGDFDHNRWLFETRGTYGYGNAIWPDDGGFGNGKDEEIAESKELMNKSWRPLTRKVKIPAAVISPYR